MATVHNELLGETLAAAEAVLARGEPLTYGALSRELKVSFKTAAARVQRYVFKKAWPHKVCRIGRGKVPGEVQPESVQAIAAIGAIRARGEPLTYAGLAAEMGVSEQAASSRVNRLRELKKRGACDVDLTLSRPARPGPWDRESIESWQPDAESIARIEARRAAFDAEKRRQAIDGRDEVDDPGLVSPPRSRWRPNPEAVVTPAQECRDYLDEWKQIRGRV